MGLQHRSRGVALATAPGSRTALDLALVLDTTGSMGVHLAQLRRHLRELSGELREHVDDLRCAVVAFKGHGGEDAYVTRELPFTRRLDRLRRFLEDPHTAAGRGGGAEAVECALRVAGGLSWRPRARKALLLVGDRAPLRTGRCPHGVDWRDEVELLAASGVALHAVCVGDDVQARRVFEYAAARTGGAFLPRVHVRDVASAVASICHREAGDLGRYRARLARQGALTATRAALLESLV